ncbi:MAG: hypothetical protein ACUVXG_14690 [Anaerolineae bacterium]
MKKPLGVVLLLGTALTLASCGMGGGPTPSPATPTPALIPTATPPLPPPPLPTPAGPFLPVGYVAELRGEHGVAGQARVVADRQILIRGFSYDGKGQRPDIRLARQGQLDPPLAILMPMLETPFQNSALVLTVPPELEPGLAEVIAVYSPSEGKAYAVGVFAEGKPETPPPPTATPTSGPFESPLPTPGSS